MSVSVGTPAMADLEREMTPILAEVCTLGPGEHEHSAVKELCNWFEYSQRTVEEFNYVIGPLLNHVHDDIDHFESYFDNLGKFALEFLAIKRPILEGPWELSAWILVLRCTYFKYNFGSLMG